VITVSVQRWKRRFQDARNVDRGTAGSVFDLVPAARAVGDDQRLGGALRTAGRRLRPAMRMETSVMIRLVSEGAGHAQQLDSIILTDSRGRAARAATTPAWSLALLMAMAVEKCLSLSASRNESFRLPRRDSPASNSSSKTDPS